jgi:hypothetical protein
MPGFRLIYGGSLNDIFSTYEIGETNGSKICLNLELIRPTNDRNNTNNSAITSRKHFGRIVFHTDDVDELYKHMKNNKSLSADILFETLPSNAPWGERYFHKREPDGSQLSFARPLV